MQREKKKNTRDLVEVYNNRNKIISNGVMMRYDDKKTRKNLNQVIIGGSGSGKSRFVVKPNILNGSTSIICTDPKGELLSDTGSALLQMGYKIKVLDLIHMSESSDCYNPFEYIRSDTDIQDLVDIFFKATSGSDGNSTSEPYWDNMASALMTALISYCYYFLPKEQQNFSTVNEILRLAKVDAENDNYMSDLDKEMENIRSLPDNDPRKITVKFYDDYHKAAGKALQSIQSVLSARLNKFNIEEVKHLTSSDTLDIEMIGQEKTALFIILPPKQGAFNFIASLLYAQLFSRLFDLADTKFKHRLPIHVSLWLDEFYQVEMPKDFVKILGICRSYNMSCNIILQSYSQLKEKYEKAYGVVKGNCDTFVYLGGEEEDTHELLSKMLGKETIDTNTYNTSKGERGSFSVNDQKSGRELLTPGEVRLLNHDGDNCIVFIRDEYPVLDKKYDLMQHPNIKLGYDGGGKYYKHNELDYDVLKPIPKEKMLEELNTDYNIESPDIECYSNTEINSQYIVAVDE